MESLLDQAFDRARDGWQRSDGELRPSPSRGARLVAHNYPRLKRLVCKVCGAEFLYGGSSRKPPTVCSAECRALRKSSDDRRWKQEHALELTLKRKAQYASAPFFDYVCQICSMKFRSRHTRAKCCSKKCTNALLRRKAIEQTAHLVIWLNCQGCGVRFRPSKPSQEQRIAGRRQKFCSRECRQGRPDDRLRQLDVGQKQRPKVYAIDPIKVFERDGWKCHLCGRKTPKALRGTTNDRAPERDHITSIFDGGSDTYENSACACRRCNRKKGRKSRGQLLLFG